MHTVADGKGRPIGMFLSAGQTSDYIGARALLASLPTAKTLLADRGYDAEWFRNRLHTYWTVDGEEWRAWLSQADPQEL